MVVLRADLDKVYDEYKGVLSRNDINKLKEWLKTQPHLPAMDELWIIFFFIACNQSQELSKQLMDLILTVKTHCPEFFANRAPYTKSLHQAMDVNLITYLPGKTKDGSKVFYSKLMDPSPSKFVHLDQIRVCTMVSEVACFADGPADGYVFVLDFEGITLAHLLKLNLVYAKKYMYYVQEAVPFKIKGMHFINAVPFIDKVLSLLKPLTKKELYDMIHVHSYPNETLYEYVPKRMLPRELGGEAEILKEMHDRMKKLMEVSEEYFYDEQKLRVDESKRMGKAKTAGDLFGIEGSFKKLELD